MRLITADNIIILTGMTMSKITKAFLLITVLSLTFFAGCKGKDSGDSQNEPSKPDKENVDTGSSQKPEKQVEGSAENEETAVASKEVDSTMPKTDSDKEESAVSDDGWMVDFDAAMKKAAAENKSMLLNFTGSDWCTWCIKLHDEAFGKPEFIEKVSEDFVLVKLDFPQTFKLEAELQAQNERLRKKYGQQGFPTIYLTDSAGRPYAQTSYQPGGVDAYLKHLEPFKERGAMIRQFLQQAKDKSIEDVKRAVLIDQALSFVSPSFVTRFYEDQIQKIIELDSENKAGLRDKYLVREALSEAEKLLNQGQVTAALEKVDKTIEEFKIEGSLAQEVYYFRAFIVDGKGDKAAALENLKKAVKADPDSKMAEHIKGVIAQYFSDVETKEN